MNKNLVVLGCFLGDELLPSDVGIRMHPFFFGRRGGGDVFSHGFSLFSHSLNVKCDKERPLFSHWTFGDTTPRR